MVFCFGFGFGRDAVIGAMWLRNVCVSVLVVVAVAVLCRSLLPLVVVFELVFYLDGLPASSYPTQFLCLRLVGQVPISGWCACTWVLAILLFPLIYLFPTLSTLFLLFPTLPYFQPSYLALLCVST